MMSRTFFPIPPKNPKAQRKKRYEYCVVRCFERVCIARSSISLGPFVFLSRVPIFKRCACIWNRKVLISMYALDAGIGNRKT